MSKYFHFKEKISICNVFLIGTLGMISDCKNNGFITPVWSSKNNITTVTFTAFTSITKLVRVYMRV
jgi:hypothetical protein